MHANSLSITRQLLEAISVIELGLSHRGERRLPTMSLLAMLASFASHLRHRDTKYSRNMAGLGKGVISGSSAQFPFLAVSAPMEQRALLDAYVMALAVDPVTTRPATSIAPEPTSIPLGCKQNRGCSRLT